MTAAVKFIDEGDEWFIEGQILPIGGPVNGNDLTGSHFTKNTDYCLDWYPTGGRPGLFEHGFDPEVQRTVVGREVKSWDTDTGRWLRGHIDKANKYASAIRDLAEQGKLWLSSGAVDHLVQATKSGEIKVWPWVEWSLTTHPANPENPVYSVKSTDAVEHMAVIGIEVPEAVKADADETEDVESTAPVKDVQTFADIQSANELDEELPTAFDTLRSAIWGAIWAWDMETNSYVDAATREAAIAKSLDEFKAYVLSILAKAARSAPPLPGTTKNLTPQALHDAALASGAKCASEVPESPPEPVLAIRASDDLETVTAADLSDLRVMLVPVAAKAVKEKLRLD